jgi:hypothetical protein
MNSSYVGVFYRIENLEILQACLISEVLQLGIPTSLALACFPSDFELAILKGGVVYNLLGKD